MMFRKQSFGIPLLLALAACGNSKSANDPATAGSSGSSATSGATTSSATTSGATTGGTTTGDTTSTTSATTSATTTEMSTTAGGSTGAGGSATLPPPGPPGCGLKQAAFCDTFDTPSPGGRGGDLDDAKWSVARISGENNQGQGAFNVWGATTTQACGKKTDGVSVPNDMFFCAGGGTASMHFNDSYNDGGDFTIHSYRIRQPFDFSGRTGIVAFDVDARGSIPGGHGFWFNIFISDEPIPAPYQNGAFTALFARAGVGIEFESVCSDNLSANTVSNVFIEKGYKITKEYPAPPTPYKTPCLKTKEEVLNHIEIRISQSKIEILGSDAGEPNTFRSLMVVDNVQVPLSRGYVHLQHTHYNATKCTFTGSEVHRLRQPLVPDISRVRDLPLGQRGVRRPGVRQSSFLRRGRQQRAQPLARTPAQVPRALFHDRLPAGDRRLESEATRVHRSQQWSCRGPASVPGGRPHRRQVGRDHLQRLGILQRSHHVPLQRRHLAHVQDAIPRM